MFLYQQARVAVFFYQQVRVAVFLYQQVRVAVFLYQQVRVAVFLYQQVRVAIFFTSRREYNINVSPPLDRIACNYLLLAKVGDAFLPSGKGS